jgi:hypothetical protein
MPSTFGPGLRRLRPPRMLFTPAGTGVLATLWGQDFQTQGPEGELTAVWVKLAENRPAFVAPMDAYEVNEFGARDIAANVNLFAWRDDDGLVPQLAPDDRATFTDTQGEAHTLAVRADVDEGYAGLYVKFVCAELTRS